MHWLLSGFSSVLIYPFLTWAPAAMFTGATGSVGHHRIADSPQVFGIKAAINAPQEFIVHHLP